jgi:arylsulfatase A-like enzyme
MSVLNFINTQGHITGNRMTNVLFIILDTQRRDRLSVYGHPHNTSPYLDDFASRSTIFERAVAPAQWTIPAHASLFTGNYASTHQFTQANHVLSGAYPTLAEILNVEGYHTVGFCNNPLVGVLDNGLQRGFDHFYNYAGASPNRPTDGAQHGTLASLQAEFSKLARNVSNRFAHNDALFRLSLSPLFTPIWTRFANYKGNNPQSLTDLVQYWTRHRQNQPNTPIFAYVNLMGTHMPLHPPQAYLDRINPQLKHSQASYRWMSQYNGNGLRWISPLDEPLQDWQAHTLESFYDAAVLHQDEYLGQTLNTLDQRHLLDDTLVIIAADHGEGLGDHEYFGHSFVVYHELVHVPLIIRYPERFPEKRVTTNISTRRIFHTILDVAGVKSPLPSDNPNSRVAELSLVQSLNGKPDTEQGIAYSEAFPPQTLLSILERNRSPQLERKRLKQVRRGVYREDYKLAMVGTHIEQLFNVAQDPFEQTNIATQHHDVSQQLCQEIAQFVNHAELLSADTPTEQENFSESVQENLRALGYLD